MTSGGGDSGAKSWCGNGQDENGGTPTLLSRAPVRGRYSSLDTTEAGRWTCDMNYFVHRALLIPCLILLALGCGTGGVRPTANQPKGDVPILYLYGEGDRAMPPAGFHVRRSDNASGPFSRINAELIPAPKVPDYSAPTTIFRDRGLPVGSTWFYYLEVVDAQGRSRKATPVVSARVVIPQSASDKAAKPSEKQRKRPS